MSIIAKKPYEISLWDDDSIYVVEGPGGARREITQLVEKASNETVKNHVYREVPVVVIGKDSMDAAIRAFNPKLTQNLNGSNTLTFDLFYRYYDEESGSFRDNPFISLIQNERKIKLKYGDEWFHFIVKQIEEESENNTFSYTCTDQYINELAKTGYEIELDTELENNMGTIVELGNYILEGSDWHVDEENCDLLQQRNIEPLVPVELTQRIVAKDMQTGATKIIARGQVVFVCYTSVINEDDPDAQFFYVDGAAYIVDEDGVIVNSPNWTVKKSVMGGLTMEGKHVSDYYMGNRLIETQKTVYVPEIDKYCLVWNNQAVYSFEDTEYASLTEIQQMITNATNFTSTMGWTGVAPAMVTLSNVGATPTLKLNFASSGQKIANTGFFDNRAQLQKGFIKGDKFVFAIKTTNNAQITGAQIMGVSQESPYGTPERTLVNFNSRPTSSLIPTTLDGYAVFQGTVSESISYDDMMKYVLNFYVVGNGSVDLYDAKLFKYSIGKSGRFIVPDMENAINAVVKRRMSFFNKSDLTGVSDIDQLPIRAVYYDNEINTQTEFTPYFNPSYEKIRSIEGSKSNRFNLIQELCETFECWAKFSIEVDSRGAPTYYYQRTYEDPVPGKMYYIKRGSGAKDVDFDEYVYPTTGSGLTTLYERLYNKTVVFKEFIGRENYAGFKYGINLKSIQRKIDSNQIVSKMIVQPNANQYAPNGFCSIQQATMNPTGETAMFNFEYYIRTKLLDKEDLYRDLYGDGMGYFTQLYRYNQLLEPMIEQLTMLGTTLTGLLSRQQIYSTMVNEAKQNRDEYINDIANALGISKSAAGTVARSTSYNDVVNSYITKRDSANTIITQYSTQLTSINTSVDQYDAEYKRVAADLATIAERKEALNAMFYKKYSRFIQEGTWVSEEYVDPDLYYMDAAEVGRTSAFPKVSYTINVIELSQLDEYKNYAFKVGDKTYIEDTEFFGYVPTNSQRKFWRPYQEEIIVSKTLMHLDDPSQNVITVQNYKTQFEDLFQRIAAATTSLQYKEGSYNRASNAVNPDGTLNSEFLRNSLDKNVGIVLSAPSNSLEIDVDGGTIRARTGAGDFLINSKGILIGSGNEYKTAISADGINASVITTGRLNTGEVVIYGDNQETFRWDAYGLSAYAFDSTGAVSLNKFTRMDKFGFYGIVDSANFRPSSVQDVINAANFSLTWQGLRINLPNGQNSAKSEVIRVGSGSGKVLTDDTTVVTGRAYYTYNASTHTYTRVSYPSGNPKNKGYYQDTSTFVVYGDGSISANNGYFSGEIQATSGKFTGEIQATGGTFTGTLKATTLEGTLQAAATGGAISGVSLNINNKFKVDSSGNVTMTGNIKWGSNTSQTADSLYSDFTYYESGISESYAKTLISDAFVSSPKILTSNLNPNEYPNGTIAGMNITGSTIETSGAGGGGWDSWTKIEDGTIDFYSGSMHIYQGSIGVNNSNNLVLSGSWGGEIGFASNDIWFKCSSGTIYTSDIIDQLDDLDSRVRALESSTS